MDKTQKLLYQRDIEKYLESRKVYELFQELMKNLVINKPDDPIEYIIEKLSTPQQKKIFIVGPPGSSARGIALHLADYLGYNCTSVGDLLQKEISKKTEIGREIEDAIKNNCYVSDEIVIDLVKRHLNILDKEKKSCVIEGFPKTRVQSLKIQRAGIIPDTFVLLNVDEENMFKYAQQKIEGQQGDVEIDIENAAKTMVQEYKLNIGHVKEIYKHNLLGVDAQTSEEQLLEEIVRLVKYKIKSKAPKRAPRVLVVGPPGTDRHSLSSLIAEKYGFIHVSTARLLADQISKKTQIGRLCLETLNKGELVPDDIIFSLVANRLKQPDCQIHGYVLQGFPKTANQIELLETLKIQPTVIVMLDRSDESSRDRVSKKRLDPLTGNIYDLNDPKTNVPGDVKGRLTARPQDTPQNFEKRLDRYGEITRTIEQRYTSAIFKVSASVGDQNALETIGFYLENS